ncbi:sugar phosphate isomerase/epimerase [Verrucomicrobiales bacterium]|jgi:hexulose-6-phosphate isomerase|nr:sugar phosphate isomerase/epimerase [Verrucomicrobiales bacterium]
MENTSRRNFLSSSALASMGTLAALGNTPLLRANESTLAGRFYKTLKIGMAKEGETLVEKFKAVKEAGFDGIELSAPGINIEEVNAAIAESGLPVDGSVCAAHWQVRHSDPDESVRAEALKNLLGALEQTKAVGGHTVLLVVGHGKDGTEEKVWNRTVANMKKAIPLASELGVAIAVENVWNHFCYDHEGGADQTAEKFVRFIDEFDSPWVGMQFDIGNHWKYGNTGDWIRDLGKRIIKLDVKGFSRAENKFTDIGEGDLDFPDVCNALREINYHGWCAAEVGGGNLERLKLISSQMDREFELV